jgi:hypothetical protein
MSYGLLAEERARHQMSQPSAKSAPGGQAQLGRQLTQATKRREHGRREQGRLLAPLATAAPLAPVGASNELHRLLHGQNAAHGARETIRQQVEAAQHTLMGQQLRVDDLEESLRLQDDAYTMSLGATQSAIECVPPGEHEATHTLLATKYPHMIDDIGCHHCRRGRAHDSCTVRLHHQRTAATQDCAAVPAVAVASVTWMQTAVRMGPEGAVLPLLTAYYLAGAEWKAVVGETERCCVLADLPDLPRFGSASGICHAYDAVKLVVCQDCPDLARVGPDFCRDLFLYVRDVLQVTGTFTHLHLKMLMLAIVHRQDASLTTRHALRVLGADVDERSQRRFMHIDACVRRGDYEPAVGADVVRVLYSKQIAGRRV